MSNDNFDLAAIHRKLQDSKRGWWGRNWRRLVLAMLLLVILAVGGAYWFLIGRIHHLDVYQKAMQTIRADKQLQNLLGEPMHSVKWPLRSAVPSARIEDREIDILWAIQGPKGQAKVHLHAKMMKKWEIDTLQITVNGKTLSLQTVGDSDSEAPVYIPAANKPEDKKPGGKKPEGKKSESNAPAPEINFDVPPGGPPSGK